MLPAELDQADTVIGANVVVEDLNDSFIHLLGVLRGEWVGLIDEEDEVSWSLHVSDQ